MATHDHPTRVLIVLPSWVGDAVMATPAIAALRTAKPGVFLGALAKPGIDQLLAGPVDSSGRELFDEVHVDSREGVMGVKRAANKIRARRYSAAIVLPGSFSSALLTRVGGVPRRYGYDRDGRGILLTDKLRPPKRRDISPYNQSKTLPSAWAPFPACRAYTGLVELFLGTAEESVPVGPMQLGITPQQEDAASEVLRNAGVAQGDAYAVLNPGGNKEAKRWPADRFAAIGTWLARDCTMRVLVSGSPAERELCARIAEKIGDAAVALPDAGITLGALKGVLRDATLLVTNDTGPRHIAAAFATPVVALFGPTDPRWTTIPFDREVCLTADPTLPIEEIADDHPERCTVDRIAIETVQAAIKKLLKQ